MSPRLGFSDERQRAFAKYNTTQGDFYGGNFWDARATGYRLQNSAAEQGQVRQVILKKWPTLILPVWSGNCRLASTNSSLSRFRSAVGLPTLALLCQTIPPRKSLLALN